MFDKTKKELEFIIDEIYKDKPNFISPAHFSGDSAIKLFEERFKNSFIESGVGRIFNF